MPPRILPILLCLSPIAATADMTQQHALARQTLSELQAVSFENNREYGGFIGLTAKGTLVASQAVAGTKDECHASFPDDIAVVASYHTHGAFDRGYFNEVPSDIDVEGDAAFFMDGYVATPSGRFWFIEDRGKVVRQFCDPACLPTAPEFIAGMNGEIALEYTFEGLELLLAR